MLDRDHTEEGARRYMLMQELGRQMQLISEEATCSLWGWQIEDDLPCFLAAVVASGRTGDYLGVEISPVYAEWLVSLAAELGHWVIPGNDIGYVPYIPRSGPCRPKPSNPEDDSAADAGPTP